MYVSPIFMYGYVTDLLTEEIPCYYVDSPSLQAAEAANCGGKLPIVKYMMR